jgi:hypothetical protein
MALPKEMKEKRSPIDISHEITIKRLASSLNAISLRGITPEIALDILGNIEFTSLINFANEDTKRNKIPRQLIATVNGEEIVLMDVRVLAHTVRLNPYGQIVIESEKANKLVDIAQLDEPTKNEEIDDDVNVDNAPTKSPDFDSIMKGLAELIAECYKKSTSVSFEYKEV